MLLEQDLPKFVDFYSGGGTGLRVSRQKHTSGEKCQVPEKLQGEETDNSTELTRLIKCVGSGGYRAAMSTFGCASGCWFFDVNVVRLGSRGHVRVGWTSVRSRLDMPVGSGESSYAFRDVGGTKVHGSRVQEYAGKAFGPGDVIRCCVDVDAREISFFKNSEWMGVAFSEISSARYFAAVSLYEDAEVTVNVCPGCGPCSMEFHNKLYRNISEIPALDPLDGFVDSEIDKIYNSFNSQNSPKATKSPTSKVSEKDNE